MPNETAYRPYLTDIPAGPLNLKGRCENNTGSSVWNGNKISGSCGAGLVQAISKIS